MPDNIRLQPKSSLLFMREDSGYKIAGGTPENRVRINRSDFCCLI